MVLATRPRHDAFTPAQIAGFYFRPCRGDHDEVILEYFRCRCGTVPKQTRRNGYSNLMQHVRREHTDYEAIAGFYFRSCRDDHDEVIPRVLPLSGDTQILIQFCVEPLVSAMDRLTRVVERAIAIELPDRFGLLFDGWTHASEHFIAVFACYEVGGFLTTMLPRDYDKQLSQCLFLVADNCSAAMDDLKADLDSVHSLMLKLRTLSQSSKRRLKTALRPVIRQDTRWSSTFGTVKRYFELLDHLDMNDDALELKKIESDAKALPAEDVTLLDVRVSFDGLLTIKSQYERCIGPQAWIVHSPDFEVACVRILSEDLSRLKRGERPDLEPFRRLEADSVASGAADQDTSSEDEAFCVEELQKRRRLARKEIKYGLLSSIHPTSNVAERFFSVARTTFDQERHSLQPITLEMILFLRQNSRYWNAQDVGDATR
ncbi:hypothetical protein PHMEG_00021727 [Phytophthora megakarya]|uniref:HAT C-terminal dimerisation domain-containing protein n=1 Tax=Phytophthora megakarya TaxID=4795 RepID=A0A225VKH3_9STRA|nr:hypothetical protein PHMEG_00021727 [Phytophthora megakarya]